MDVIEQMRRDQERIETLLKRALSIGEGQVRVRHRLVARLADSIAAYLQTEERIFFPAVNRAAIEDLLLRLLEENLSIKRILADLVRLREWFPTFGAKLDVLASQVREHFAEERTLLFPKVRALIPPETREEIGKTATLFEQRAENEAPRLQVLAQTDEAAPLE